jgi:hypothetical protein
MHSCRPLQVSLDAGRLENCNSHIIVQFVLQAARQMQRSLLTVPCVSWVWKLRSVRCLLLKGARVHARWWTICYTVWSASLGLLHSVAPPTWVSVLKYSHPATRSFTQARPSLASSLARAS